ncbi:MAG: hypothetical protein HUU37_03440 [Bdellovibrionales bacterium]|nr:hypothetical protein [Bdellovibrionales bacterium]
MKMVKLTLALMTLLPLFARAEMPEGGVSGGGGDARCAEYVQLAGRVAMALKTVGSKNVRASNGVIDVDQIWNIRRAVKCIPSEKLNRQAISYPKKNETKLDVAKWEKMSKYEKLRLVMHELSVLAGYEKDGEYFVSEDMEEILRKFPNQLRGVSFSKFALEVVERPDGKFSMLFPLVEVSGEKALIRQPIPTNDISAAWGFCTRLGLKYSSHSDHSTVLSKEAANKIRVQTPELYGNLPEKHATLADSGLIVNAQAFRSERGPGYNYVHILKEVTCAPSAKKRHNEQTPDERATPASESAR